MEQKSKTSVRGEQWGGVAVLLPGARHGAWHVGVRSFKGWALRGCCSVLFCEDKLVSWFTFLAGYSTIVLHWPLSSSFLGCIYKVVSPLFLLGIFVQTCLHFDCEQTANTFVMKDSMHIVQLPHITFTKTWSKGRQISLCLFSSKP